MTDPTPAEPARRHTVDTLTDPELERLYAERDMLGRESDRLRKDYVEERTRAEQAESKLAALKRAHVALASQAGKDQAAIERVRTLHAPMDHWGQIICGHCSGYGEGSCDNGEMPYPCPTVAALDEQQEQQP